MDNGRKLDMNHGFLKSIVKNQIDRDEYHKLMEERKGEYKKEISGEASPVSSQDTKREKPAPVTPSNLYVPPHRRRASPGNSPYERPGEQPSSLNKRRSLCTGFVSEKEESRIREKVRAQVKALGDIDISAVKAASPSQKGATKPLFKLNLTAGGNTVEVTVLSTDNAARLAKGLGRQYGLSEEECRLLRQTLDKEIEDRLTPQD